jgi:hypothetical protein
MYAEYVCRICVPNMRAEYASLLRPVSPPPSDASSGSVHPSPCTRAGIVVGVEG